MFTSYKRHNNQLYNNLVQLSRNKFFYQEVSLEDKIETRLLLIFFHFALILRCTKSKEKEKENQDIFDNIFQNIEYSLRELGHGDIAVNKKMKNLTRVFYDILVNNRYGLGDFLKATDIDKFALFRIARYCDELVSDGKGGQEPRFTANLYSSSSNGFS